MRKLSKNIIIYVLIFVVIVTMALVFSTATKEPIKEVSLSKITNELASRNVSKLNVDNNKMRMTTTLKGFRDPTTGASNDIESREIGRASCRERV